MDIKSAVIKIMTTKEQLQIRSILEQAEQITKGSDFITTLMLNKIMLIRLMNHDQIKEVCHYLIIIIMLPPREMIAYFSKIGS